MSGQETHEEKPHALQHLVRKYYSDVVEKGNVNNIENYFAAYVEYSFALHSYIIIIHND